MKIEEKLTMFIDFHHLLNFQFNDPSFIDNIVHQFHRYEPYLRKAVT